MPTSLTTWQQPMSPLRLTWVPPQSSMEGIGTDGQYAHVISVFGFEQCCRAFGLGIGEAHLLDFGRRVGQDLLVDDALDLNKLLCGRRFEVVKTQTLCVDQRPFC